MHDFSYDVFTAKLPYLTLEYISLKVAFTVVRTTNTNFKVVVHSNVAVGYFELGELGI